MDLALPPSRIGHLRGEHGQALRIIAENPSRIGLPEMDYAGFEIPFESLAGRGELDLLMHAQKSGHLYLLEYKSNGRNGSIGKARDQLVRANLGMIQKVRQTRKEQRLSQGREFPQMHLLFVYERFAVQELVDGEFQPPQIYYNNT